jgi:hypothetical protein
MFFFYLFMGGIKKPVRVKIRLCTKKYTLIAQCDDAVTRVTASRWRRGCVNLGLAVAHAAARRTRTRASSAPQRLAPWP